MKIGLLTVYYSNYGSYYQASALARQLEQLGHECEIVNASIRGGRAVKFLLGAMGEHVLPRAVTDLVASKNVDFRTYHAMRPDLDELNVGPLVFSPKKLSKRYDCVLVGSDELWSATNPNMGFIPAYFGVGIDCPILSYGTSAVTLKDPEPAVEETMQNALRAFRDISVRDTETRGWVEKWTGETPPIVLDPTLLNPYFGSEGAGGGGLMVYGQHFSNAHVALIRRYAEAHGLGLHALCWKHDWCDDFVEVTSARQMQEAFSSADYCAVSTFHGVIFSLLNHRPFSAFAAPLRTEKEQRILGDLDIPACFWDEDRTDELQFNAGYQDIDARLQRRREESLRYLRGALADVENELAKG